MNNYLFAQTLNALSKYYGSQSCNDCNFDWLLVDFTWCELNKMASDYHLFNNDPDEYYEDEKLGVSQLLFLFYCYVHNEMTLTKKQRDLLAYIIEHFKNRYA